MLRYIAVVNSIVIAGAVLQTRFNYDEIEAGFYYTLPYIVAAVFSPILGAFVDKFG